jgi:hypothetical protein
MAKKAQECLISKMTELANSKTKSSQRILFYCLMIFHLYSDHYVVPEALELMQKVMQFKTA